MVGDLMADLNALAALHAGNNQPGGVGGWLQQQYTMFNQLPQDIVDLNNQITRVVAVLQPAGADLSTVADAQREVAQITAVLPQTQYNVQRLFAALAPILPQLQSGSLTPNVVITLASSGVDIVSTMNDIQNLFALRDDARIKLQQAVTNPSLPATIARDAANALAGSAFGSVGTLALIAGGVFLGWKVLKAVF